ncbi:hypothetical protein JWG45_14670 [Leptospira sp. 201903070]|uniref:DUF1564 family protein n=1 Tax=Leptospira ainlahdjerensis TaxID=2810033 RepID=A0ABS2UDE5_9LEPT|nr:hypothetical protein [Leptospira ainlahdjerensis]MBM9578391.1 hypothetical protein [Leptospira ainlahdjerensis]
MWELPAGFSKADAKTKSVGTPRLVFKSRLEDKKCGNSPPGFQKQTRRQKVWELLIEFSKADSKTKSVGTPHRVFKSRLEDKKCGNSYVSFLIAFPLRPIDDFFESFEIWKEAIPFLLLNVPKETSQPILVSNPESNFDRETILYLKEM